MNAYTYRCSLGEVDFVERRFRLRARDQAAREQLGSEHVIAREGELSGDELPMLIAEPGPQTRSLALLFD